MYVLIVTRASVHGCLLQEDDRITARSCTNAYMLAYIRDDCLSMLGIFFNHLEFPLAKFNHLEFPVAKLQFVLSFSLSTFLSSEEILRR